jgi:hypothetical protein
MGNNSSSSIINTTRLAGCTLARFLQVPSHCMPLPVYRLGDAIWQQNKMASKQMIFGFMFLVLLERFIPF